MNEKGKNTTLIIVIIAAILLICCFISACCAASVYFFLRSDSSTSLESLLDDEDTIIEKIDPSKSENESGSESDSATPNEMDTVDESGLTANQRLIIEKAEEIRGLSADIKLAPIYQTQDELRAYMLDELYADTDEDEFTEQEELYRLLGFIPADFDIEQFYLDMYTEQIAGFYDSETDKMYLIDGGSELDNSLTLAHEYTHYLQYNNSLFSDKLREIDNNCDEDGELCVVMDAIVEGDATLTEYLIEAEKDLGLEQNYDTTDETADTSVFDSAPKFFQDSLLFPYTYGYNLVSDAYMKGGFDKVDQLYQNPPASVEQVMHPEKYPSDVPTDVNIEPFTTLMGQTCEMVFDNVLNEADFSWLIGSGYEDEWQLTARQVETAATGWDGGSFQQARCDGKPLFFTKMVWDSEKDAEEAFDALELYSDLRFENKEDGYWTDAEGERVDLIRQNDIVFWMITPDTYNAQSLLDLINTGSAL